MRSGVHARVVAYVVAVSTGAAASATAAAKANAAPTPSANSTGTANSSASPNESATPSANSKPTANPTSTPNPTPTATPTPNSAPTSQLGLYRLVRKGETDPALKVVDDAFRQVAEASRRYRYVVALPEPAEKQGCGLSVPCLAGLGGLQNVDEVFAGDLKKTENGLILHARLIDTRSEKVLGDLDQVFAAQTPAEAKVWAESLACKLLMGGDCLGEALIDADLPEMRILVDNQPVARSGERPERLKLPVGAHRVRVAVEKRTSLERPLFVSREPPAGVALFAREREEAISLESPEEMQLGLDGKPLVEPSLRPRTARWNKTLGATVAAVGVIVAGVATYEGIHARSLISDANRRYAANEGAFRQGDLATISSARSAAATGNILLVAGAALVAAGLTLHFAF